MRSLQSLLLMTCVAGCAAASVELGVDPARAGAPALAATDSLAFPPAGLGTLREDQFSVELRSDDVLVRITPLEDWIIRLAAPDTYHRLSTIGRVQDTNVEEVDATGRDGATRLLVSFFSREPGASFRPTDVIIESSGREYRPDRIQALTPGWGEQRLQQGQPEVAVYLFEETIDLTRPVTMRYGRTVSYRWGEILPALHEEEARVQARAEPGGS